MGSFPVIPGSVRARRVIDEMSGFQAFLFTSGIYGNSGRKTKPRMKNASIFSQTSPFT
jgi:hypothetical protein